MNIDTFNSNITPIRQRLVARALTGDDNLAEDLAQEVMLKLWNIRDKFDNHGNIEALAMAVLRNKKSYKTKTMRSIIIAIAAFLPCTVTAAEANDTTVNYQGRKYVIGTNNTETKITVYEKDSVK